MAGTRRRIADLPTRLAAAERQVPRYSGQLPKELANVRCRRPLTGGSERSKGLATCIVNPLIFMAPPWAQTSDLRIISLWASSSKHQLCQCPCRNVASQVSAVPLDHGYARLGNLCGGEQVQITMHQVANDAASQRVRRRSRRDASLFHCFLDRPLPCVLVPHPTVGAGEQGGQR